MTRWFRVALVATTATLWAGCPGPVEMVDAGPSTGDVGDPAADAFRAPDAAEPVDAPRGPDATAPRCVGDDCDIVEIALLNEASCARRQNGEVWCWGRGGAGELGDGASGHMPGCPRVGSSERTDCSNVAVRVALTEPAARLYAQGGYDACVEDADGAFSCWGAHGYRIGTEPTPDRLRPERVPTFDGAQSFANAFILTCWLDADGAPWCIGDNGVGELGQGDFALYVTPVRPRLEDPTAPALEGLVEIATSTTFGGTACARTAEQLYCWGQNDLGQIGDPAPHTTCVSGIDEFDCTPWVTPVAFERTADIARLSLGSQHTCALLTDATVWCWGQNRNGELALGSPGMQDVAARRAPVEVTNLTDIAQIELGARHSCARRNDGTVWCWGSNDFGQLGDGVLDHPEPSCMNGSSLVDCTSVPVQVAGIDDAVDLDVGRHHSCVIRGDATVWCWGINDYYEVAAGTRDSVFTPTQVTSL